jgi:uncharacterized protein YhbP (UPF0306 family)
LFARLFPWPFTALTKFNKLKLVDIAEKHELIFIRLVDNSAGSGSTIQFNKKSAFKQIFP